MNTTMTRFGSGNGAVNFISRNAAIPMDDLRKLAPSIFAESPHGSRSGKYAYIPTSTVLTGLMEAGFRPYSVAQGGSRDEDKRGFTKHVLRLRHDSQVLSVGGTHNEIVLLNSHDGTSSYRLMAGVFRLVCSNGMIVSDGVIEDVKIPHKGDVQGLVIDGCIEMLDRLPEVSDSVARMESMKLTDAEQTAFARAALVARYGEKESPVSAQQIIQARRRDDSESTLWQTLNRAQENIVRGGVRYVQKDEQGRRTAVRRTREIKGIDQNTTLNRALWTLADEMMKLKA